MPTGPSWVTRMSTPGELGTGENQKIKNGAMISSKEQFRQPKETIVQEQAGYTCFLIETQEKQQIVSHFVGELQTIKASGPTFVPTPILGEHEARPNQKTWELTQV